MNKKEEKIKRHWIKFLIKATYLYLTEKRISEKLVNKSYNQISSGYDKVWTNHMRDKSIETINRLKIKKDDKILDLTCGTGFVTYNLSKLTNNKVTGVDASSEMLKIAVKNYKKSCEFIQDDVIHFLKTQQKNSYNIITCAWGLGYTKPYQLIKESSRILKHGGQLAIIDNSFFSIREPIIISILTMAEKPESFKHMFKVNFLPYLLSLKLRMEISGLRVVNSWDGDKTYWVKNGNEAIDRLLSTGAFAGLQYCFDENKQDEIQKIFKRNIEKYYMNDNGIPITHRYIGAIGKKR